MNTFPEGFDFDSLDAIRTPLMNEGATTVLVPVRNAVYNAVYKNLELGISHLVLHFSTTEPPPSVGHFTPIDMSTIGCRTLAGELITRFPGRVYQKIALPNLFMRVTDPAQIVDGTRTLGLVVGPETPQPAYMQF